MALAPARIVSIIVSSVGPPVAIIGTSGNCSLIFLTIPAVLAAPDTFIIDAPASSLAAISVFYKTRYHYRYVNLFPDLGNNIIGCRCIYNNP